MNLKIGASLNFYQDVNAELRIIKSLGYDYAEVGLGLNLSLKDFKKKLKKISKRFPILSLHLPQIDFKDSEIEKCKKIMDISSHYGVNVFIIHLYSINVLTKDNLEFKIKALQNLVDFVKLRNLILALENTEEDVMDLKQVFEAIPDINFCLDIGHANMFVENQSVNFLQHFGNHLKHIHIHDNYGGDHSDPEKYDKHLPVGKGNIEFEPIFEKLKEINYSGTLTVESTHKPTKEEREISLIRVREFLTNLI
jgi:sugar phosphate isomerase/epimerase